MRNYNYIAMTSRLSLQVLGDCYAATEDYTSALSQYSDAMTLAATLGDERSSTALQNQLLNCMAGVQVQTRCYSDAARCLEQALQHQTNVESRIQGDLIGLQYKLGVTYTLSGDLDKAVDCFEECLEALGGAAGVGGARESSVHTRGKLANLYHVKGLMQEDNAFMEELLLKSSEHFSHAADVDRHSSVCVQYANFLTQQGKAAEALDVLLPFMFSSDVISEKEVTYSGVEQAILPEHLQNEADDIDAVTIDTKVLAYFLGILCFKELKLNSDVTDCLEAMYKLVLRSNSYFNHALMGYAFMEADLFSEAAECFATASRLHYTNDALSMVNCCLCLYLHMYQRVTAALKNVVQHHVPQSYINFTTTTTTTTTTAADVETEQQDDESDMSQSSDGESAATSPAQSRKVSYEAMSLSGSCGNSNRDSGYFDTHPDSSSCDRLVPSLSSSPVNPSLYALRSSKRHSHESSLTLSHDSDSSYMTDQSMLSDDRAMYESSADDSSYLQHSMTSSTAEQQLDNTEEVEIWETIDSKGNVIEPATTMTSSTTSTTTSDYNKVENNGNYVSNESQQPTPTMTSSHYSTYNDNYQRLYESVHSALNERWLNKDQLDNDTINKLKECGYVVSSPASPQKKPLTSSQGSSESDAHMAEEMGMQVEVDYENDETEEQEEVWEVFEETVDTPPELLALLMNQTRA